MKTCEACPVKHARGSVGGLVTWVASLDNTRRDRKFLDREVEKPRLCTHGKKSMSHIDYLFKKGEPYEGR